MEKELQDKAWAVLPKEFKEEVKRIYKSEYVLDRGYQPSFVMMCLIMLFGEHKLTSDTDETANVVSKTKPKFKVGDKVMVMNIIPRKYVGEVGVVASFSEGFYDIKLLDGGGVMSREDDLEPYDNTLFSKNTENGNHIVDSEHKLKIGRYNIGVDTYLLEPRLQVATAAMQGLLNATSVERFTLRIKPSAIAKAAVEYADALLAEINGKGGGDERNNN